MDDFFDSVTDELSPITEGFEQTNDAARDEALGSLKASAELNTEEESWLEQLVDFIFSPIIDVFESSDDGVDSERISLSNEVTEETVAQYDLTEATEEWHVQDGQYSCAVCCQQFIINEFLDMNVSEQELADIAEQQGWYDPESGTAPANIDNLLELYGIDTQMNESGTMQDIAATLEQGGRVIAAVDGAVLAVEGTGTYPWSGADHVVEVIGIDDSDPNDIKVIINDSGVEDGCGKVVSLSEFEEAWSLSGGLMVSAFPND